MDAGNLNPIQRSTAYRYPDSSFSLLSLFWKDEVGLCELRAVCLSVVPSLLNFWMPEPIFMKLGMYIMATEPISTVLLHKSLPSVCVSVCVSLLWLLSKGLVKTFLRQRIHAKTEELLDACLWVCLRIPLSLLGNNSVKTFQRQRRIVGCVVFYAVCVVSKESRLLVLPRTSC
jgi:hypothetical protein